MRTQAKKKGGTLSARPIAAFAMVALALLGQPPMLTKTAWGDESAAHRLRTDVPLEDHISRRYGTDDGLPSNWVNLVLQSRTGFIWVGTDNGLARYDGDEFRLVTDSRTQQSPKSDIRALYESRDGVVWVGTSDGLARIVPGYPSKLEWITSLAGKQVFAILQRQDSRIWIGTNEETFVGTALTGFRVQPQAPHNVRVICERRDGAVWLGSHTGLFVEDDGRFEQVTHSLLPRESSLGSGVTQTRVNAILEAEDGDLWIGTNRALLHYRDGEFTVRGREIEAQQIYDLCQTQDGAIYATARFGVFRSVDGSDFQQVDKTVSAFSLIEDEHGGIWIGHGDNRGLRHFRNRHATAVWTSSQVRCLFRASDDELWFGAKDGLHRLTQGRTDHFGPDDGLPEARVQSIACSDSDSFWIATATGLAKWSGSRIVSPSLPAALEGMNVSVVLEDSKGALWLAIARGGGYRLHEGELSELESLSDRRIQWFFESSDGVIWIGHEAGLFRWAKGQILQVEDPAFNQLGIPRFLCHHLDQEGVLWMGTSNGIVRWRDNRFDSFAPDCGLLADNIERLTTDRRGNLWFGGRDGLFFVSIRELDQYGSGQVNRVTSNRIPGFDRFPPVQAFSQSCLNIDDTIWIACEMGLVEIPVEPFLDDMQAPTIQIEKVTVDGSEREYAVPFDFPSGRRRVSFEYVVLALQNQSHVQVAYQLKGHDPSWVTSGNEGIVQYTDLRPGDYEFVVRVRRGNESWIEAAHPVVFSVTPRWWERTWLRLAAALAATLAAIAYFRHRLTEASRVNSELRRQMAERKRAEEQSRQNQAQLARVSRAASMGELSTSIAHEIKQPLFAIVSNAQTAGKLLDQDEPDVAEVREALSDIASDGNRASTIIDRIRALVTKEHQNFRDVDLNEVVREAASFAEPEIRRRQLHLVTKLASEIPSIAGDPIELQQVVMNLLHNGAQAMKGATSRELTLRTSLDNGWIQVAVEDRGIGIDEDQLQRVFEPFYTTRPQGTGMGLAISRTIIDAHGGRIGAERNPHGGMTFTFQIPVSRKTAATASDEESPLLEPASGGGGHG